MKLLFHIVKTYYICIAVVAVTTDKETKTNVMKHFLFTFLMLLYAGMANATFAPVNLKVNGLREPLAIDTQQPTFSWETQSDQRSFRQSAYEITVADTDGTVVWKSGKTSSSQQN